MLSIIVPTLNEQDRLPRLLNCLRKQTFQNFEVIIADANSTDRTKEIALAFGCKIVEGGIPSHGRNQGIKAARGNLILSLDADLIFDDDFLEKAIGEFNQKNLDVATFLLLPISEKRFPFSKFLFNFFYNYPLKLLEGKWVHGTMGILIKKSIHKKIGGWDEEVRVVEDHDYVKRASKIGKFGVIKSTKIFTDLRRFKKEGWVKVGLKYAVAELHFQFKGPIKKELFQYKFDHYKEKE